MSLQVKFSGKVIIAGAGPGDPDLITVKASEFLSRADVVITDRLVSDEIIKKYVNPFAEIIYAGKQAGKGYSTRQTTISNMLVDYALKGKLVVRLKGGDVSFFSNVLDELLSLKKHNIPFEIIPGITAASGAAAYSGIPLTARNYSTAVRFLTYYKNETVPEEKWNELAATDDTLVFYMSGNTLDLLINKLIEGNIAEEKLMAVVEQATTPMQNIRLYNIYDYQKEDHEEYKSPSLIIIGKVVGLHQDFSWLNNYTGTEEYFRPLSKAVSGVRGRSTVYS